MFNLLKVELYKLRKFPFWYIAMLFMFIVGYIYGDARINNRELNAFDNTAVAFYASVSDTSFVFIISIIAALFIGMDFSNRTIDNEIKLGHSRFHILLSRMIVVCASMTLLHVIFVLSTVFGFSVMRGFDPSVLSMANVLWLLTVLVQLMAVLSGVVLISFAAGKASEAIVLSGLYAFICCNVLRNYMHNKIFMLSCYCFAQNNSAENLGLAAISAFVTMAVFMAAAAFMFNKAEIK